MVTFNSYVYQRAAGRYIDIAWYSPRLCTPLVEKGGREHLPGAGRRSAHWSSTRSWKFLGEKNVGIQPQKFGFVNGYKWHKCVIHIYIYTYVAKDEAKTEFAQQKMKFSHQAGMWMSSSKIGIFIMIIINNHTRLGFDQWQKMGT